MRGGRAETLGQAEADRELFVVSRRPHRHRDGTAADADLERFLDRNVVALTPSVRQPNDLDRRCGVRRSLHVTELTLRVRLQSLLGSEP
jgi:hypothetical protein